MDKITVTKMVEEHLEKLSISYTKDPGYDYLKQICSNYKLTNIDGFLKSDIYEVFKGYFYLEQLRQIPISDVCKIIDCYRVMLDGLDYDTIDTFRTLFDVVEENDLEDISIEFLENKVLFREKLLYKKLINATSMGFASSLAMIKENYSSILPQMIKCLKLLKEYPASTELFYYLDIYHNVLNEVDGAKFGEHAVKELTGKVNKKYTQEVIKNSKYVKAMLGLIKNIPEFVHDEEQNEKRAKKKVESEAYALKNSMVLLKNALKCEEITNTRQIISGIHDEEIRYAVLQLIDEHNQAYSEKLDCKIEELSNNSVSQYSKILADYNVSTNGYDITVIMHNSLSEVEHMVGRLRKNRLTDEMILYVLTFASYDKFMEIFDFVDKKFLSIEYLKSNLQIFWAENNFMDIFKENIQFLTDNGINPKMFFDSPYLLFKGEETFKNNIMILKEYDLLKYLKTTDNFEFLNTDGLVTKIDMLLEFGYIEFLKQDLGLLNYTSFNRLQVMKVLGEVIKSKDELASILDSSNRFFVPDNMISKYVGGEFNIIQRSSDVSKITNCDLDTFRTSSRTIEIDDVILSSHRLDRKIKEGNSIIEAISSDPFITDDEFNRICDVLKQKTNK